MDIAKKPGEPKLNAKRPACRLLTCLLRWDPDCGRRAIARQTDAWLANGSWKDNQIDPLDWFITETAKDAPSVLRLFEAMAWKLPPDDYQDFHSGEFVTAMLSKYGNSPFLKRSKAGLLTDPQSPWCLNSLCGPV